MLIAPLLWRPLPCLCVQFCCLACSRVFILEQFIHHLVCANHLQKCQVQLSAFGNAAKRQKV